MIHLVNAMKFIDREVELKDLSNLEILAHKKLFVIVAKKIADKQIVRAEKYLAYDLDDM
jgi:hypothetical protein